ncbi:ABC transporter transmembrane domain-containing protein [Lacticaseibacillus mingshuiensis]|uniref:ABC transporter transmembrane domain-containing protein n=1 Tax=Lacticaseibacillus mingshuiensis TaxID=2799574 RepID=A0ABW4CH87_9LACO|nr:ABC transporter ATP-binding protein [Lacticaseibacillus mingshuiensis]
MKLSTLLSSRRRLWLFLLVIPVTACIDVATSWLLQLITDVVTRKYNMAFGLLVAVVVGYILIDAVALGTRNVTQAHLLTDIQVHLQDKLFDATSRLSLGAFTANDAGVYLNHFGEETTEVRSKYYGSIFDAYALGWQLVIALIGTLLINPKITLVALALCVPALIIPRATAHISEQAETAQLAASRKFNSLLTDFIHGYQTLRLNLRIPEFGARFKRQTAAFGRADRHNRNVSGIVNAVQNMCQDIQYFGTWVVGGFFVYRGTMSLGQLVAFSQLVIFISYPLFAAVDLLAAMNAGRAVKKQLSAYLASAPEDTTGTSALPLGQIRYSNVTVQADDRTILSSITAHIDPTAKTVIVGASGSGKSTLMRSLFGYYEHVTGGITIAGQETKTAGQAAVSSVLAYLPQDPYVFSGTLKDNVTLFASAEDEDVAKALNEAGLGDWDNRLNEPLHNNNGRLSGGERKRLGLARLALGSQRLPIYDELTSGLDPLLADTIEHQLFARAGGFVYITHRDNPEVFEKATQILVLSAGHLIAAGAMTEPAVTDAMTQMGLLRNPA